MSGDDVARAADRGAGRRSCPGDEVLVGLALGELTGRERADALAHLVGCRSCRDEVDALIATTERILLAAPEAEPPAGFEAAVLDRTTRAPAGRSDRPTRSRRAATLAVAASVVAVLALAASLLMVLVRSDPVAEAAMITPNGREVGTAWIHDVEPTWLLLAVPGWEVWETVENPPEEYRLRVELDDGETVTVGPITLEADDGSWAGTTELDPERIRSVAIVDDTGRTWCEAHF